MSAALRRKNIAPFEVQTGESDSPHGIAVIFTDPVLSEPLRDTVKLIFNAMNLKSC